MKRSTATAPRERSRRTITSIKKSKRPLKTSGKRRRSLTAWTTPSAKGWQKNWRKRSEVSSKSPTGPSCAAKDCKKHSKIWYWSRGSLTSWRENWRNWTWEICKCTRGATAEQSMTSPKNSSSWRPLQWVKTSLFRWIRAQWEGNRRSFVANKTIQGKCWKRVESFARCKQKCHQL